MAKEKRRFFSLKWRAIFLTSLVLLGLASVFTFVSHLNMTHQFQLMQDNNHERQINEINMSIERDNDNLRQLASIVAAAESLGTSLADNNKGAGREILVSQWPTLQLSSGLEEVRVFRANGENFLGLGTPQDELDATTISKWVNSVRKAEIPLVKVLCRRDCRQYAIVPVLLDGNSVGVVMISRSFADVALYTQQSSGSDIALVLSRGTSTRKSDHYLDQWGMEITAITNESFSLKLLSDISERLSFEELVGRPRVVGYKHGFFELLAMPINADDKSVSGYFILTSNVTNQIAGINRTTRYTLAIALLGWLSAEVLLFCIMWRPMARLRKLAYLLPALAQGGFDRVRQNTGRDNVLWHDEIDVLDRTAQDLADQLEVLESEVDLKGKQLNARVMELSHERDFIAGLLNTAHVLILTQNNEGRITLVNHYALELLGTTREQLMGLYFNDVFHGTIQNVTHVQGLSSQYESIVRDANQEERIITWVHAPMGDGEKKASRISVGLDISARKKAEHQLAWLAHRDPLTELYNRRFFQQALEKAVTVGAHGAVLYLDLDQFKTVNELGGHHAGDQLLRLVADALSKELAREHVIARQGGDEFSVLLENASAEEAIDTAEKVHRRLEKVVLAEGGRQHRAIASIGIALYPEHGDNETDLMASADLAMYKAKESGTRKWHLLSAVHQSREELQQRVYWVECIRNALSEDSFVLMLQPIVNISDYSIKHYEVLIRMRDEKGNLRMPASFIPVAERSGLIVEIDRWVIRQSLLLLKSLQDRKISLAINLSGPSLHDETLKSFLENEIIKNDIDPTTLIIEITETAAVTDFTTARSVLQGISILGCKIALDDFGVGFSSFHYLDQLPADFIKIDGSFIQHMMTNEKDRLIVKSIADIGKGFGKSVIAEFVDKEEMIEVLREYGVSFAQGYYMGRPFEASSFHKKNQK